VAVQLEKRVSVDVLVDVQQRVRMSAADRAAADRAVRRDRAELPVLGDRAAGLVRREFSIAYYSFSPVLCM